MIWQDIGLQSLELYSTLHIGTLYTVFSFLSQPQPSPLCESWGCEWVCSAPHSVIVFGFSLVLSCSEDATIKVSYNCTGLDFPITYSQRVLATSSCSSINLVRQSEHAWKTWNLMGDSTVLTLVLLELKQPLLVVRVWMHRVYQALHNLWQRVFRWCLESLLVVPSGLGLWDGRLWEDNERPHRCYPRYRLWPHRKAIR